MLAEVVLKIDGQDVSGRVYENRERAGQFLIMNPDIFVVERRVWEASPFMRTRAEG